MQLIYKIVHFVIPALTEIEWPLSHHITLFLLPQLVFTLQPFSNPSSIQCGSLISWAVTSRCYLLTVPPEWRHLLSDSKNSEGVFSAVAAQSALLVLLVEKVAELVTAKTSLLTITIAHIEN